MLLKCTFYPRDSYNTLIQVCGVSCGNSLFVSSSGFEFEGLIVPFAQPKNGCSEEVLLFLFSSFFHFGGGRGVVLPLGVEFPFMNY